MRYSKYGIRSGEYGATGVIGFNLPIRSEEAASNPDDYWVSVLLEGRVNVGLNDFAYLPEDKYKVSEVHVIAGLRFGNRNIVDQ